MVRVVLALDDRSQMSSLAEQQLALQLQMVQQCGDIFTFQNCDPRRIRYAPPAEIYVVDFGGLGIQSHYEGQNCARDLLTAIHENPSRLYLVWSTHTVHWYRSQIADMLESQSSGDDVADSVAVDSRVPLNAILYRDDDTGWGAVRSWLGVPVPESTPEFEARIDELWAACDAATRAFDGPEEPDSDEADAESNTAAAVVPAAIPLPPLPPTAWGPALPAKVYAADFGPLSHEIVATIQLPVRIGWHPGTTRGKLFFKYEDTTANVEDDTTGEHLGSVSGTVGGRYQVAYSGAPEHPGAPYTYYITPQDMWAAMESVHMDFKAKMVAAAAVHKASRESQNGNW